jgi:MFS family permease
MSPTRHDPMAALRHRSFVLFLASRFFTLTAMTLFWTSVSWQVWDLARPALARPELALAGVGLARFVPQLALTLLGGAVADVFDRRRIAMLGLLAPAVGAAWLCVATVRGDGALWLIYAVTFALAVSAAFESPARTALLPTLVPRDIFPNAVVVNSTAQAVAMATGPALAGLVIASAGVAASYALNTALVAASMASLAFVRPLRPAMGHSTVSWSAIATGLRFVRRRQAVLGAMSLDMIAVIFGGAQALIPVYATEILGVGARGYGLLAASLEIGALSMAALLIWLPPIQRVGRALLLAVAAYGVATIVFGMSRVFPLSVAAYMAVGMADQISVVTRHTLIQLATPDALRGRVSAINSVFIGASNHLGAVEAGTVAALTSATFAVVSGGAACLLVVGLVAWKLPDLRRHHIGAEGDTPD